MSLRQLGQAKRLRKLYFILKQPYADTMGGGATPSKRQPIINATYSRLLNTITRMKVYVVRVQLVVSLSTVSKSELATRVGPPQDEIPSYDRLGILEARPETAKSFPGNPRVGVPVRTPWDSQGLGMGSLLVDRPSHPQHIPLTFSC